MYRNFIFSIAGVAFLVLLQTAGCTSREKDHHPSQLKPSEEFFAARNFPHFEEAGEAFLQALDAARASAVLRDPSPPGFDTPWQQVGPRNIGGRINTIARHPNDAGTYLAGLVAGGIFKTTDGGATWYPVFDDQPVLSISRIVFDPSSPGVVYAATGDPNISSYIFLGQGIYKSTDDGESWSLLGLDDAGIINALAIDPSNPQILYAGSMGIPLRPGSERGFYRSEDGGLTWEKTLYLSQEAGITDILIDPDDPEVVFACGWHRVRNQAVSIVSGPLSRVYRSKDRGLTWDTLTSGLPQGSFSRPAIAWSQGRFFVRMVGTNQQLEGIYASDDQGDSWYPVPLTDLPANALGGFGWYFGKFVVNPQNMADIFLLGVDLWRTRNGGLQWEKATPFWWVYDVHADKHDLVFTPEGHLVLATDGGLYRSLDDGETWARMDDIPNTQFYRIAWNPHDPEMTAGGSQDNGTTVGTGNPHQWEHIYGGDGFQPAFHPEYPEIMFAEWQNGNLVQSSDYGFNFVDFTEGVNPSDNTAWDTPYFVSMHPPHAMWLGTNRVYRNDNPYIPQWYPVSDKLTDPAEPWLRSTHVITALGESPLVPGRVYAGTGDGRLWGRDPQTDAWTFIADGLPQRFVTSCQGSPTWPDRVFVTHSGYKYNQFASHVHRSEDGGQTWTSINGDLPPLAVNDLVVLPGHGDSILFAATDAGIYGTVDGGQSWHPLGTGMPAVPVYDMTWNAGLHTLVAGSHARSAFALPLAAITDPPVSVQPASSAHKAWRLFPNPGQGTVAYLQRSSDGPKPSGTWRCYNSDGQLAGQGTLPEGAFKVNLPVSGWSPGVYFFDIISGDTREVVKWIKTE